MSETPMGAGQPGLGAEFQVMDTAAGHVESVRGEVDALLRRVTGSVEDLASAWLGGAGGAFQKVMVDWNDQSRKLNEALGGIAETVRSNRSTFTTNEDEVQSSITRVGAVDPLRLG